MADNDKHHSSYVDSAVTSATIVPFKSYDVNFCGQVKLVKCIVQNIVVDISFNQIGGLCTLCFLEKVQSESFWSNFKYLALYFFS